MAVVSKGEIATLSTEERLARIDELWESIEGPLLDAASKGASVPEWQRQILDQRLADLDELPDVDMSLAQAQKYSLV